MKTAKAKKSPKRKESTTTKALARLTGSPAAERDYAWLHPSGYIHIQLSTGTYRLQTWRAKRIAAGILKALKLRRENEKLTN